MPYANPSASQTPARIYQTPFKNQIGMKPIGISTSVSSAAGRTWSLKITAPADFDAVRLFIYHLDTSSTTVYRAIAAVTETALNNTANNITRPIVGAAEQNVLDGADNWGWKSLLWAGAATVTPAAGSATVPAVSISDWMPLTSVPRADGSPFPLALIRMSVQTSTSGYGAVSATMETPTAANGGFILQSRWDNDASGLMVSAPATNHMTASNAHMPSIGVEFRCLKRGITLLGIGDTLMQQSSATADTYSTIGWRVAAAISALGIPCGYVNHGFTGATTPVYSASGSIAITNWKPNAVIIQTAGITDGNYTTDALMRNGLRSINSISQGLVADSLAINATPFVVTWIPSSSTIIPNESQDSMRRARNQFMLSQQTFVKVLDWDSIVTDGAAPSRIAAGYQLSTTTPNEAAIALQAVQAVARIREAFQLY